MNVQGCSYSLGRPCWLTTQWRDDRKASVCKEKSAEELRQSSQWAAWVEQLRTFSQSDADLRGKADASILAQAMWDHGCQFQANLTAEGISTDFGGCVNWNDNVFDFEMKTLENICPETCSCNTNKRTTACPRPLQRTCEVMEDCLWYLEQHWCPHITPTVAGTFVGDIANTTLASQHWDSVLLGLQHSFAQIAGSGIEAGMVHLITSSPDRRLNELAELQLEQLAEQEPQPPALRELQMALTGSFSIFLVDGSMRRSTVRSAVSAVAVEDLSSLLRAKLANLSVPEELGISLSSFVQT